MHSFDGLSMHFLCQNRAENFENGTAYLKKVREVSLIKDAFELIDADFFSDSKVMSFIRIYSVPIKLYL